MSWTNWSCSALISSKERSGILLKSSDTNSFSKFRRSRNLSFNIWVLGLYLRIYYKLVMPSKSESTTFSSILFFRHIAHSSCNFFRSLVISVCFDTPLIFLALISLLHLFINCWNGYGMLSLYCASSLRFCFCCCLVLRTTRVFCFTSSFCCFFCYLACCLTCCLAFLSSFFCCFSYFLCCFCCSYCCFCYFCYFLEVILLCWIKKY